MNLSQIDKRPLAAGAAAQATIVAGINMLAAFGLMTITADQLAALNAFLALVLPAVMAILIRNKVVPTIDLTE